MSRTCHLPGLAVTDHAFTVPLDHADPAGASVQVFARELTDPARVGERLDGPRAAAHSGRRSDSGRRLRHRV
ncbi:MULTISPECIES: hypothetical protein [Streptomyces]|uniref:hypothetical protein n=1 Tax=Streptomyces TaxID=1883 RepID=UPI00293134E6|nr:hypothetical protein [Streptomyces sp. NEAU-HV9]